jgi:hypothetical protein
VEYRNRPPRIIGERLHIYACKSTAFARSGSGKDKIWSRDLTMADELPEWMLKLGEQIAWPGM